MRHEAEELRTQALARRPPTGLAGNSSFEDEGQGAFGVDDMPTAARPFNAAREAAGTIIDGNISASQSTQQRFLPLSRLQFSDALRRRSISIVPSDTDDSDCASPTVSFDKGKRKHALLDESVDSACKRRAVSPGVASPMIASSSVTKHTNMKQMQDASDGIQGLTFNIA
jgi:hypothetical protein